MRKEQAKMWNAALADEKTEEFQVQLRCFMQEFEDRGAGNYLEVLHTLQELWQKYYLTTGHKRLARVFLKEVFE